MTGTSNSGRTHNAKRNIIYGFLQVMSSRILPFITRTILIYRFGVDYLGLNSLFTSVLSVLSLMELGFGTAIVYSMYKPVAENDSDRICAYLSYYRKIYRFIGLVILVSGLILMPFLKHLVHDPVLPGGLDLYLCYLIFLIDTVISYLLLGYMRSVPAVYQRRDILSRVDMLMGLAQCAVKSVLLLVSNNFYLFLISIPAFTVLRNLVTAYSVRKKYPDLKCKGKLSIEEKRELNRKVHGLMIDKVTAVSRNSIDTLCISSFIGLSMTGMYNNYYFVMIGIAGFSNMLLESMRAGVGNSIAVESREKNYADMRLFDFIYTGAAGWVVACMLCLYRPFIQVWLGERMMPDIPVVIGLCAYFYILRSGDIRYLYHEGRGLWYESRFIMIGEAVANIILNIVLCRTMGVFGIILATVISVFITNYFLCPGILFRVYFRNGKLREYWTDHLLYTMTMVITGAIGWLLCEMIVPMSMIARRDIANCILCLGGRLLICTVISVSVFWIVWHRKARYHSAVRWINKVVKA